MVYGRSSPELEKENLVRNMKLIVFGSMFALILHLGTMIYMGEAHITTDVSGNIMAVDVEYPLLPYRWALQLHTDYPDGTLRHKWKVVRDYWMHYR